MNILLNNLDRHFSENPGKTAIKYDSTGNSLTYGQLNDFSARVYRYLKNRNIKKEDIIMIHMKRSIEIVGVMIGIWKAGAAVVICEDSMPRARVDYILSESNAVLVINEQCCREISSTEPLYGREPVSPHDAAFILYTSGSTGNPKGIIHEFGTLDFSATANIVDGAPFITDKDVLAVNPPLSIAASVDNICKVLNEGATLFITDSGRTKDTAGLFAAYETEGVTVTFMTPSFYKICKQTNSQMRLIILGGEACSDIYASDIRLYNAYSLSEAGRGLCLFPIDRAYPLTPIGHNWNGEKVVVLDENGHNTPPGTTGELCFQNDFFRGYIGDPELTSAHMIDGLFHSGDLATMDENGNITILGRSDDMIKINGNRIEPEEIEKAAKEVLGLSGVAAKGFAQPDRSFVVLYYTDDINLDPEKAGEMLQQILPHYMVPLYYVRLKEFPLLPSGKLARKSLPVPRTENFRKSYSAPVTPVQKELCDLFTGILKVDTIGIDDDFFELGGDSIKTIRLITEANRPEINFRSIFRHRTVRALSDIIEKALPPDEHALMENEARQQDLPLNATEAMYFSFQTEKPDSVLPNIPLLWQMKPEDVDTDRLLDALYSLTENHAVFKTVIRWDVNGTPVKHFDSEFQINLFIEHMTEQSFEELRPFMVQPFEITGHPLYRIRLFQTEKSVYLFIDMHHMISDKTSFEIILKELSDTYRNLPVHTDCHYLLSKIRIKQEQGDSGIAEQYHNLHFNSRNWKTNITCDHPEAGNHATVITRTPEMETGRIQNYIDEKRISLNIFAVSCVLLAIKKHENKNNIMICWAFNGRESIYEQHTVGCMLKQIPVAVSFDKIHSADDLLLSVKKQTVIELRMSADPYIHRIDAETEKTVFCVRTDVGILFNDCIPAIPCKFLPFPDKGYAFNLLDLNVVSNENGTIHFLFRFNDCKLENSTAERFAETFMDCLYSLVNNDEICIPD